MESQRAIDPSSPKQRAVAVCAIACAVLCAALWASLAVAPLALGTVSARACGACVAVAIGALAVNLVMAPGNFRAHAPHGATFPLAAITAGAVLYIVLAMALGAVPPTTGRGWGTALIPVGIVISSIGSLVWTRGTSSLTLSAQVRSHLQAALDALPAKGKDKDRASALDEAGRLADGDTGSPAVFCVIGCVLFVFGAALCLAVPGWSLAFDWAGSLACALASMCAAAVFIAVLYRQRLRAEDDLAARKTEIDNTAGIVHAQIAVAEAERKANAAANKAREAKREARAATEQAAILGGTTELEDACRRAAERYGLSQRELDVLIKLAHGRSRPKIAESLKLTISTVNSHVQNIYRKMSVHNSQQLIDILERLK